MIHPAGCAALIVTVAVSSAAPQASEATAELPARRERAVSPRMAEMLAAVARREFAPAAVAAPAPAPPSAGAAIPRIEGERPANDIVRLPTYIVRERKVPKAIETLNDAELAKIGMNQYIGLPDGLDRGYLNRFTIVTLWKKIPVLGKYQLVDFETNEERGLRLYRAAKKREEWENMMSLLSPKLKAEVAPRGGGK